MESQLEIARQAVEHHWSEIEPHTFRQLDQRIYCLRVKDIASSERFELKSIQQHGEVELYKVLGIVGRRDRHIGYCLIFRGWPIVHYYVTYLGISYTNPEEVQRREVEVIHNDRFIRLTKAGVGICDYLLVSRKASPMQFQVNVGDAKAHKMFAETWKDGI